MFARTHFVRNALWISAGLILGATGILPADEHWPNFRGEAGTGFAEAKSLPATWSTTKNVAWTAEIAGSGWSSPIVWGERVFVTACVIPGQAGAPKVGFYLQDGKIPAENCRWIVTCLDLRSGAPIWTKTVHEGKPQRPIHPKNSYAAATPSTDGQRLIVYFAEVGVVAYDLSGNELWRKENVSQPTRSEWGPGASPVLHEGKVYWVNDNEAASFAVALDAASGDEVWRVERAEKTSWATPFVWQHAERTELVTSATSKVRSYDLSGKLLWELSPMSEICIPVPVASPELLYVSSGYEFGNPTRPIYAIRPGASGDISLDDGQMSNEFVAWSLPSAGPYNPSPLLAGDNLYVLYSQGFLACYDTQTGKEIYKRQRLGGTYTASPWAYGDMVFCLSEDGVTTVVKAGPKFQVLHKNSLDETALATPAMVDNALLIRTATKLYALRDEKAE